MSICSVSENLASRDEIHFYIASPPIHIRDSLLTAFNTQGSIERPFPTDAFLFKALCITTDTATFIAREILALYTTYMKIDVHAYRIYKIFKPMLIHITLPQRHAIVLYTSKVTVCLSEKSL